MGWFSSNAVVVVALLWIKHTVCHVYNSEGDLETPLSSDICAEAANNSGILLEPQHRLLSSARQAQPPGQRPPRDPPQHLEQLYTRCGTIPLRRMWVDDTNKGHPTHFKFSSKNIERMVGRAQTLAERARSATSNSERVQLPFKDRWIVSALATHANSLQSKHVAVIGSMEPWYEALLLAFGASKVTTIEYNQLTYDHPQLETITPSAAQKAADDAGGFDAIVSLSSIDHDGLGRYGEPLAPDGDLLAMDFHKGLLKPTGLMFLTVPVGADLLVWNLHRRYGPLRLRHLLHGWDVVQRVGWEEGRLDIDGDFRHSYEPVFVLRPGS